MSTPASRINRGLSYCCIGAAGLLGPVAASAQQALEEVVVTATKRGAMNLQDTPFSVQAMTGEKLADVSAMDFNDFFRFVPGLAVFDQGPGDKRIVLRGVNAVGAGTVGIYLDEIIITGENAQDGGGRQPDIKLFDLDRVEVLKGPQGTTFGSSSLSGTIRYITNQPDLAARELEVDASMRQTERAELGGHGQFAANLPIVEDRFALRLAGYYLSEGGFIDSQIADDVNSEETFAARAIALFQATDNLSLSFTAMYQNMETDGPFYFNEVDNQGNPLPDDTQSDVTRNPFDDEILAFNGKLEYLAEIGTFTATASRFERDTVFSRDSSLVLDALGVTMDGRSVITQPKDREVTSVEARFASEWDFPVQALIGVFAQQEERFFQSRVLPADPATGELDETLTFPTATGRSLDRNVDTEVDEIAVFGEFSWDLTARLNLTGGFRWFDIDVEEVQTALFSLFGAPGSGMGPELSFSESDVIGRVNLSYAFTDDVMAFAQWGQGFRAGGVNDPGAAALVGATIPQGFGSDSLDNLELGVKSTLWGGRLQANASIYYTDWADIQLQAQAEGQAGAQFPFRTNGGAAEILGVELDVNARPIDALELGLTAAWTDAQLSEDNPDPSTGLDGDRIPYVPEFTVSLTGRYERPLQALDAMGFVGGDVFYVDERTTELNSTIPGFLKLDDYAIVNLRAGMERGDWSATFSVNNVFDDDTRIDVFRIITGLTPDGFIPQRPRTFILSLSKRFF